MEVDRVGFIFNPTDVELLDFYLKRKIASQDIGHDLISDVNLQDYHPSLLIAAYKEKEVQEKKWYFFTPRNRKYPNGKRPDRKTNGGFWKATGVGKIIRKNNMEVVGVKTSLVFYEGSMTKDATKTNWIMKEYRKDEHQIPINNGDDYMKLDDWVLCKIYENTKSSKLITKKEVAARKAVLRLADGTNGSINSSRKRRGHGDPTDEGLGLACEGDTHSNLMENGSECHANSSMLIPPLSVSYNQPNTKSYISHDPSSSSNNNNNNFSCSVSSNMGAKYEEIIPTRHIGFKDSFSAPGPTHHLPTYPYALSRLNEKTNANPMQNLPSNAMVHLHLINEYLFGRLSSPNENPCTSYTSPSNGASSLPKGPHELSIPNEIPTTSYGSPSNVTPPLLKDTRTFNAQQIP